MRRVLRYCECEHVEPAHPDACRYCECQAFTLPDRPGVDCWIPGRIVAARLNGKTVPADWRERLQHAGYALPGQLSLDLQEEEAS